MEDRYAVLIFPPSDAGGSGSVEAVPSNWLTPTKTHCYWPPFKNPLKLSRYMKDCAEPQKDWNLSEARCLEQYPDYKTARRKSDVVQFTSDLESQEDTDAERQRSRERRKRQYDSEDSRDESPQVLKKHKAVKAHKGSSMPTKARLLFTPPPPPFQTKTGNENALTPLYVHPQQSPSALSIPPPPRQSTPFSSTSAIHCEMTTPGDYRPLTEETGRKLVTLVMEMKYEMKALQQQNQHIIDELLKGRSVGARPVPSTPKLPDGVLLPLQNFDQVTSLERKLLRSSEERRQLVNYLGLIGGLTIKATTVNVLSALLMNDLARQFNFCGQRGKHGFKSLQLRDVLHEAVRANRLTRDATNTDVDSVTMEWLRTACDRCGGRQSRGSNKERDSMHLNDTV